MVLLTKKDPLIWLLGLLALSVVLSFGASTMPHKATLYYQSIDCTNHSPCQILVWRAVCPTPTTCPVYVPGSPSWSQVTTGGGSVSTSPSGTKWIVVDTDPSLQDNTTYAYVATVRFTTGPRTLSDPSPVWSGTTSGGTNAGTPPTPTNGVGNSVH
jgi:hypothetical protein